VAVTEDVAQARAREQWVDTLRVVLISGVIVVHTATAYVTDFAGYYYDDERVTNSAVSIALALPALMGGIFGLGPLFVVAGWFSVGSLARRGRAAFVGSRLLRLGLPLVLFVLLVNPLADLLGNLWGRDRTNFVGYLADTEFSIMWFVVALLVFSLGYAALRSLRPRCDARRRPGRLSLIVAAALIGSGSWVIWQFTTLLDTHLMNVRISAWTQGAVLFALGVAAAEAGWDGRLSRRTEHRLGQVALVGVGLTLVLVSSTAARDHLDMALGGLSWASVAFAVLYGGVSIAFALWCLAWLRRRWPTHGPLVAKAGRGS
jgi:glucan biosynthesis protein C